MQAQFSGIGGQESQTVQLKEGEGRRYERISGRLTAIPVDCPRFRQMHIAESQERYQEWTAYSKRLREENER